MPSFSRPLEETLHRAVGYANARRHEYATLEHLLLALIDDPDATGVMQACNVDLSALKAALTLYVDNDLAALATSDGEDAKPTAGLSSSSEPLTVLGASAPAFLAMPWAMKFTAS